MRRCLLYLHSVLFIFILLFNTAANTGIAYGMQNTPSFTDEEKALIASFSEPIKVGYVKDRVPVSFSDENGEFKGISLYIFDHISNITGLKFDYVPLPEGEVTYDYLLSEGFDLVTSVEYNKENQNARGILTSHPYLSSRKVVVAKNDMEFRYDADLSIAISKGSQTIRKVLGQAYPNFDIEDYDSIEDCLNAVNTGKSDLMIQNQYVVEYWFSKPKYDKLKVIPVPGLDDQLCFSAVVAFGDMKGPSPERGQMLINILDKAIDCISEDEVSTYIIQGIMENPYKLTLADFLYRYRFAAITLAVSLVIIIILAGLLIRQRVNYAKSKAETKAKDDFLSTMSHEIRTPLNGLVGLNNLMAQTLDDKSQMEKYLRQSTVTTNYLLSLVNDILDTSKLQSDSLELVMRPVELELMLSSTESIIQSDMADKGLRLDIDYDIKYPCILGDEVRIQQILLNLLDNACKFTPEGGSVSLSLKQDIKENNKVINSFTVSDTGRGMSEEFQKHIFDVFSRELNTVSKGNQGTGLGLYICRSLALLMNGDLKLEKSDENGSTFIFTFVSEAAISANDTAKNASAEKKSHPNILVAEDNELNGEIIIELLRNKGFKADLAENGKKAYEIFKESAPYTYGVILMDLLMPEMDGFKASKAIRSLDRPDAKTVHIFACTANSSPQDKERAFECGMNSFITKPVNIVELIKKLDEQE